MTPLSISARLAEIRLRLLAARLPNMAHDVDAIILDVCRMERTLNELVSEAREQMHLALATQQAAVRAAARPPATVLPFKRPVPALVVGDDRA
jgi:ABC-type transporter Mla subunit MlaD